MLPLFEFTIDAQNIITQLTSQEFTNLLMTLVVPFVFFFAVIFWVLKLTKVFGSNNLLYVIIAASITLSLYVFNPSNIFGVFAQTLVKIGIAQVIIGTAFIVLFFVIKIFAKAAGLSWGGPKGRIGQLRSDVEQLMRDFESTSDSKRKMEISMEIQKKEHEILKLKSKLHE